MNQFQKLKKNLKKELTKELKKELKKRMKRMWKLWNLDLQSIILQLAANQLIRFSTRFHTKSEKQLYLEITYLSKMKQIIQEQVVVCQTIVYKIVNLGLIYLKDIPFQMPNLELSSLILIFRRHSRIHTSWWKWLRIWPLMKKYRTFGKTRKMKEMLKWRKNLIPKILNEFNHLKQFKRSL